jgi:hypothetical protein
MKWVASDVALKIFPVAIVDFLARKIADRQKCSLAKFCSRTRLFLGIDCAPASGGNRGCRRWNLGSSSVPARPRGWAQYLPSLRP